MRKKKEPKKIYVASSRRVMLVLMSLSTIYQYMYSSLFFPARWACCRYSAEPCL